MGTKTTTKNKKVKVKILRSKPWEGKKEKYETYEVPSGGEDERVECVDTYCGEP